MKHWFSDVLPFRRDPLDFMLSCATENAPPLKRLLLGPKPVWLVTDPEVVKPVLKAPEEEIDKGRFIHKLRKVLGVSSLSLSGEEHRKRRAILHNTFAKGASNQYAPEMSAVIRRTALQLIAAGCQFDAHAVTSRLSLRLVSLAMFGKDVLTEADEQVIVESVAEVEDDLADEMFRVLPLAPWQLLARRRRRARVNVALDLVVARVRSRAPKNSAVGALEELGLTDVEMRNEILTMILAGYHTTGNAAAWILYHLATVPGLADLLANEGEQIIGPDGEYPPARLMRAEKSLAAVRETLRLYPSSYWFSRDAMANIEVAGTRLRKGDAIIIAPWLFHRSSLHWPNPNSFDLSRDFGSRAYLPFGTGPRVCVGMGIVMLELQLIALEFAAACQLQVHSSVPAATPKASITLVPPPIAMSIGIRDGQSVPSVPKAA